LLTCTDVSPAADLRNSLHCPGEARAGGLLGVWAPVGAPAARHFCWAAQGGLVHGALLLEREKRPASDLEYLALDAQLPLPTPDPILSMVCPRLFCCFLFWGFWGEGLHRC
jgi:hypothetical protein